MKKINGHSVLLLVIALFFVMLGLAKADPARADVVRINNNTKVTIHVDVFDANGQFVASGYIDAGRWKTANLPAGQWAYVRASIPFTSNSTGGNWIKINYRFGNCAVWRVVNHLVVYDLRTG